MDWVAWHDEYDRPDSPLATRLRIVRERIRAVLDACPPGPLTAVSLCAGQGRDLLGVLADHARREDVRARLVEYDPRNVAIAEQAARTAGLYRVEVVDADAGLTDAYAGMVPADLVVACGVLGNMVDADVERTVETFTRLCRHGGRVVWTRHRAAPDLVPQVRAWFAEHGFTPEYVLDGGEGHGAVGVHRYDGETQALEAGRRIFTFVPYRMLRHPEPI